MTTAIKYSTILKSTIKLLGLLLLVCNFIILSCGTVQATVPSGENNNPVVNETDNDLGNILGINISTTDEGGLSGALQIVLVLTVIALCPSLLIMLKIGRASCRERV